jgi:hypothetical protein
MHVHASICPPARTHAACMHVHVNPIDARTRACIYHAAIAHARTHAWRIRARAGVHMHVHAYVRSRARTLHACTCEPDARVRARACHKYKYIYIYIYMRSHTRARMHGAWRVDLGFRLQGLGCMHACVAPPAAAPAQSLLAPAESLLIRGPGYVGIHPYNHNYIIISYMLRVCFNIDFVYHANQTMHAYTHTYIYIYMGSCMFAPI